VLRVSDRLVDCPFHDRLHPNAIEVVKAAQLVGAAAILPNGDAVFQSRKIEKSGLSPVFVHNVLIYVHKELELADVETHFPVRHYVMSDDKLRILDAIKYVWGDRVTAVFPRQGHFAADPKSCRNFRWPTARSNTSGTCWVMTFQPCPNNRGTELWPQTHPTRFTSWARACGNDCRAIVPGGSMMTCRHTLAIREVAPSAQGCEECLKIGSAWLHLRLCRTCGHVGCCDDSPHRHATAHFHASGHPIIEGYDPPEGWGWCYIDEVEVDLPDQTPQRGPIPRYF